MNLVKNEIHRFISNCIYSSSFEQKSGDLEKNIWMPDADLKPDLLNDPCLFPVYEATIEYCLISINLQIFSILVKNPS